MSSAPVGSSYYADFSGLESLKRSVKADDPKAIRAAAQQFESLFTTMMLKSMREAKVGQGLGESSQSDLYQDMYDQQVALKVAQGRGLGLADMLVQQLTRNRATPAAATTASPPPADTGTPPGAAAPAVPPQARIDFIRQMEPYAQKAGAQLGVSADTLIAQAALETGWGQHQPVSVTGAASGNLFGIKAGTGWQGSAVSAMTTEFDGGGKPASLPQPFRSYASVQAGVNDYVTLLQHSSRYGAALGTGNDVQAFGNALTRGGYATDPHYVQKLIAMVAHVRALKNPAPAPTTAAGEAS